MKNKKGISELVATVLQIVITIAAVGIIVAAVMPIIKQNIEEAAACKKASILILEKGFTCYKKESNEIYLQMARGAEDFPLSSIQLQLYSGGESKSIDLRELGIKTGTKEKTDATAFHFDEGQGSITYSADKKFNGTLNKPKWTEGIFGKALQFDGIDDNIIIENSENSSELNIAYNITIEAIFNSFGNTYYGYNPIFAKYGENALWCYRLLEYPDNYGWYTGGEGGYYLWDSEAGFGDSCKEEIEFPQWTTTSNNPIHIVAIFNPFENKVYLNGELIWDRDYVEEGYSPWLMNFSSKYPLVIGADPYYYSAFFNGTIDEIFIYKRALSEKEILEHASSFQNALKSKSKSIIQELPKANEEKTYIINAALVNMSNITSVSVAPVIKVGKKEINCGVINTVEIKKCS